MRHDLRQAAALTGVAKETISDIERGLRHPHDITMAKIADGYGVSLEDLLELGEPALPKAEALETGPPEPPTEDPGPDARWMRYGLGYVRVALEDAVKEMWKRRELQGDRDA